jgi:diketogulonate reductase-like aldo/keto reductase
VAARRQTIEVDRRAFAVFDFELSREELAAIDRLDTAVRGGPK